MHNSLFFRTDATILCLLLFIACLLTVMLGHRLRMRLLHPDEPDIKGGVNSLMGALFGLWGFLLAFTFSNSASRFESVRSIMVDETNAMRNVILRSKTFPDSIGRAYRTDLGKYLQARIDYFDYAADPELLAKAKQETITTGLSLWDRTVQVSSLPNMGATAGGMFGSLSSMFDVVTKRDALLVAGVPEAIQYLLFFLAITISFIGGFTTPVIKYKEGLIIGGFALLACCIIYLTLDLGRPMRGFIRPESVASRIADLKKLL